MDKTIAILGAGPNLGQAIARRFGSAGFRVALVARNAEKLAQLVSELQDLGIEAAAFPADVTDETELAEAFLVIEARFGQVDVLEFSPVSVPTDPAAFAALSAVNLTAAQARKDTALSLGAIAAIQQVLPGMIARKSGTILVTCGASAKGFAPMLASWGFANAALRNYVRTLGQAVRDEGVYVAPVILGAQIEKGNPFGDPDQLAGLYFRMYESRNASEAFINHLPPGLLVIDQADEQGRSEGGLYAA